MLAGHECSTSLGDQEAKYRAEIAVLHSQIARLDHFKYGLSHRSLLRIAILSDDDVGDQHAFRFEHDQRVTGHGTSAGAGQRLDSMLGREQMTSVEDPRSHERGQFNKRFRNVSRTVSETACQLVESGQDSVETASEQTSGDLVES
jgi:hypothetical protein